MILENGDQSKVYRYIPMFAPNVAPNVPLGATIDWVNDNRLPERPLEQLPLNRERFALTAQIAHRFDGSTIRLEERLYDDNWVLMASTTDARWIFDLGRRIHVLAARALPRAVGGQLLAARVRLRARARVEPPRVPHR